MNSILFFAAMTLSSANNLSVTPLYIHSSNAIEFEMHYDNLAGEPEITQTIIRARGVSCYFDEVSMRLTHDAITSVLAHKIKLKNIVDSNGVIWADVIVGEENLTEAIGNTED